MAPPPGFTVPLSVAAVPDETAAKLVVTCGSAGGVVNERTDPNEVPMAFAPMAHTKYVVPGVNPVALAVKGTAMFDVPSAKFEKLGSRVPKESLQLPGLTVE